MWPNEAVERRWHPNVDAYRKDHIDDKARRRVEAEHRAEAKRREQERRQAELARSFQLAVLQLEAARVDIRNKRERQKDEKLGKADEELSRIVPAAISVATGGGVIGSVLFGPVGAIGGVVLGAIVGAITGHRLRQRNPPKSED